MNTCLNKVRPTRLGVVFDEEVSDAHTVHINCQLTSYHIPVAGSAVAVSDGDGSPLPLLTHSGHYLAGRPDCPDVSATSLPQTRTWPYAVSQTVCTAFGHPSNSSGHSVSGTGDIGDEAYLIQTLQAYSERPHP